MCGAPPNPPPFFPRARNTAPPPGRFPSIPQTSSPSPRFTTINYTNEINELDNELVHLTNVAIQKHAEGT